MHARSLYSGFLSTALKKFEKLVAVVHSTYVGVSVVRIEL